MANEKFDSSYKGMISTLSKTETLSLDGLAPKNPRNGTTWSVMSLEDKNHYKQKIKNALTKLKQGIVTEIEANGTHFNRLKFTSDFEKSLYIQSNSLKKAKLILNVFENFLSSHPLNEDTEKKIQQLLIKQVNYIGSYMDNFDKIVAVDFKDDGETQNLLKSLSNCLSSEFKKTYPKINKEHASVCITTHNSGNAHRAITEAVSEQLFARKVPNKIFNEANEYLLKEPLYSIIEMGFGDLYPLIKQKGGDEELCNLYKELEKEIRLFVEDTRGDIFDENTNGYDVVYVTGMYPHNVRAHAHYGATVIVQACDYGQIPKSIHELATQIEHYDFEGVEMSIPDSSSYTMDANQNKHLLDHTQGFHVLPYPVAKHWYEPLELSEINRELATIGLEKRPNEKLLVMIAGGEGVSGILEKELARVLEEASTVISAKLKSGVTSIEKLNIVIVCGRNEITQANLKQIYSEHKDQFMASTGHDLDEFIHSTPLGFTPNKTVGYLVRVCDGYLTKPGGSSAAEALNATGVCDKMLIYCAEDHRNEFENAALLVENGGVILEKETSIYTSVMNSHCQPVLRPRIPDATVPELLVHSLPMEESFLSKQEVGQDDSDIANCGSHQTQKH